MNLEKFKELKKQYKRSNKYILCFSYEDLGELIKMVEEGISCKIIPTYRYRGERVTISERLYSGLVRSLAWKIEYQDRVERSLEYLENLDSLDSEQLYNLEELLKGE